jgi:hypothetical protein
MMLDDPVKLIDVAQGSLPVSALAVAAPSEAFP